MCLHNYRFGWQVLVTGLRCADLRVAVANLKNKRTRSWGAKNGLLSSTCCTPLSSSTWTFNSSNNANHLADNGTIFSAKLSFGHELAFHNPLFCHIEHRNCPYLLRGLDCFYVIWFLGYRSFVTNCDLCIQLFIAIMAKRPYTKYIFSCHAY